MDVKRDILWRVYLVYIVIAVVGVLVVCKAFYIQQTKGAFWREQVGKKLYYTDKTEEERGSIYSEDGKMLSISIPEYDLLLDLGADGLVTDTFKNFKKNIDVVSYHLSRLFKDATPKEYDRLLTSYVNNAPNKRTYYIRKGMTLQQVQTLRQFPFICMGANASGFKIEKRNVRHKLYGVLASRTLGSLKDTTRKLSAKGLEAKYDSVLSGTPGERTMRRIRGGGAVQVGQDKKISIPGMDIVTNLDMDIQDIAENALMKMMVANDAENGCAIVLETKTGKIKAMANLGKVRDGEYDEIKNYSIERNEPGSTFKLATLLTLLEDKKISLSDTVDLMNGHWEPNNIEINDSEKHGRRKVTILQAFELSSNVGMAKLVYNNYYQAPMQFVQHLKALNLDSSTGVDLDGEAATIMHTPGSEYWRKAQGNTTILLKMAYGMSLETTPLHTAMLYNAVANGGKMMKPYLVNTIKDGDDIKKSFEPQVLKEKICDETTLRQLKECLEGVCSSKEGTGYSLFKSSPYKVAGKTGTTYVSSKDGYIKNQYVASFAGFFPADNPQYTCVVVIKNKPGAGNYYGARVAGPVFKEIADNIYTKHVKETSPALMHTDSLLRDNSRFSFIANKLSARSLFSALQMPFADSAQNSQWVNISGQKGEAKMLAYIPGNKQMPQLNGMALKDAILLCENIGLRIKVKGRGRVKGQSIIPGQAITKGQTIEIRLG